MRIVFGLGATFAVDRALNGRTHSVSHLRFDVTETFWLAGRNEIGLLHHCPNTAPPDTGLRMSRSPRSGSFLSASSSP